MNNMACQIKILMNQYLILEENESDYGTFNILGYDRINHKAVYIKKTPIKPFKIHLKDIKSERKFTKERFLHKSLINIIVENYETPSNYYYVEDFCYLDDISSFLNLYFNEYQILFSQRIIQLILKQVVEGLDFLYENNLKHCSLTLNKIMATFIDYKKLFESKGKLSDIYELDNEINSIDKVNSLLYFIKNFSKKFMFSFYYSSTIFEELFSEHIIIKMSLTSIGKYSDEKDKNRNFEENLKMLGIISFFLATGEILCLSGTNIDIQNDIFCSYELIDFINNILNKSIDFKDYKNVLNLPFLNLSSENLQRVNLKKINNEKHIINDNNQNIWKNFSWEKLKCMDEISNDDFGIYYENYDDNTENLADLIKLTKINEEEEEEKEIKEKMDSNIYVNPNKTSELTFMDQLVISKDYLENLYEIAIDEKKPALITENVQNEKLKYFDINMTFFN